MEHNNAFKDKESDLGFGRKVTAKRLINADGSFNIERIGHWSFTPYQDLVETSWGFFLLFIAGSFVAINAFFAIIFVFQGVEQISGTQHESWMHDFAHAFFFSVQTFTTVGYGALNPEGITANILSSLCALSGLIALSLATGLFFARFSKPKAQILFSDKAIIAPYGDGKSFQFRIANIRNNKLINLQATVSASWIEQENGQLRRRYAPLVLERRKVVMLPLNWTIVHPIDRRSPLAEMTEERFKIKAIEFIVQIEGYDETYAQTIYANKSYLSSEVEWDVRFLPMYATDFELGKTILDLGRISDTTADFDL